MIETHTSSVKQSTPVAATIDINDEKSVEPPHAMPKHPPELAGIERWRCLSFIMLVLFFLFVALAGFGIFANGIVTGILAFGAAVFFLLHRPRPISDWFLALFFLFTALAAFGVFANGIITGILTLGAAVFLFLGK